MNWWDRLSTQAKALTAVVALAVAVIGGVAAWDNLVVQTTSCSFAGVAYDQLSGQPARDVRIGYDPNNVGHVVSGYNGRVVTLAISGNDGAFKGDCGGVHDQVARDSFEILYVGGPSLPGLPCLQTKYSSLRLSNRGSHDGIDLPIVGC